MVDATRPCYIRAGAEYRCGHLRTPVECETAAMHARRLLPLGLAVAGLLAIAGLASHGRPLTGSHGNGPTAAFFDYVLTTVVLVAIAIAAVFLYGLTRLGPAETPVAPKWHWKRDVVGILLVMALTVFAAWFLVHHRFPQHLRNQIQHHPKRQQAPVPRRAVPPNAHGRSAHVRWDEVAIVGALLAAVALGVLATRTKKGPPAGWRLRSQRAVAAALDESLDDLRSEPDLRRAIIAAYARMEHALARAGLPRKPAEAPFEYLERALAALDTSSAAVARLTDLFEWAKFSQHEPVATMRDEAIDALVAVRDELRGPLAAAA
jgi:hypothetical protein